MDEKIEEMAKIMYGVEAFELETLAEVLYKLGYRKIPENAVVLTREEHQKYLAFKIIEPQVRGCLDRERELEKRLETISKETAEKFAERLKSRFDKSREYYTIDTGTAWGEGQIGGLINDKIDKICKEIIGEV